MGNCHICGDYTEKKHKVKHPGFLCGEEFPICLVCRGKYGDKLDKKIRGDL